jgi:hypothetical protein
LQHQKFKNFLKIIIALFADGCMMDMCYIDRAAHEFDNFLSVILSRKMLAKKRQNGRKIFAQKSIIFLNRITRKI